MNYKVLAVGLALGFVMAVAPSCGPEPVECSAATCNGCCGTDGKCVETAAQTAAACGASGQACVACVGNATCSAGVCTTGPGGTDAGQPDGGQMTGCNPSNCPTGCCSSNGLCRPGTSGLNCGQGGAACSTCGSNETCTATSAGGQCQMQPDAGSPTAIGAPCMTSADCTGLPGLVNQANAVCQMQSSEGNFFYKDGFCTRKCISDTDCGTDGFCLVGLGRYGENSNICLPKCSQTSPCRDGYDCLNFGTSSAPEPRCLPSLPDGGIIEQLPVGTPAGDGVMGGPCTDSSACQPPTSGECLPETLEDGGLTGYPAGMCSADCTTGGDEICGNGGVCVGYISIPPNVPEAEQIEQSSVVWFCEGACTAPGTTTGCRTDYTCDALGSTSGHCIPRCDAPGNGCPQGQTCNATNGQCQM